MKCREWEDEHQAESAKGNKADSERGVCSVLRMMMVVAAGALPSYLAFDFVFCACFCFVPDVCFSALPVAFTHPQQTTSMGYFIGVSSLLFGGVATLGRA